MLLTLRNLSLTVTISPINLYRVVFYSTLKHFCQWIWLRMEMKLSKLSSASNTKPNPSDKHDFKKCHSVAFIVNFEHIQHINTLFNIYAYDSGTQISSTIYHSFLSRQPLATSQGMSPTATGSPIHDPYRIFSFSNRGMTGRFWYLKTPSKIGIKRTKCRKRSKVLC